MANTITAYNPIFYAQEALIQLEKALGMASRVHRGYDEERRSFDRGDTIRIRKPGTFTAQDAPSTAQDLTPEQLDITLSYWKEVKFALTDRELTFTSERIIQEHIRPAAYALADDIDQKLCALYKDVPWFVDLNSTLAITDVTNPFQTLFDNGVPMYDDGSLHYMINGSAQNGFQQLAAFNQVQTAGTDGLETLKRGTLGKKFGFEFFANQNVATHTTTALADGAGAVNNASGYAKGTTTMNIDGLTASGAIAAGDTFVITGNTQRYAVTAATTTDGTGIAASVSFTPPLVAAVVDNAVVTFNQTDTGKAQNLAFHRNAFAIATAPLSEAGNAVGARMASITDPKSGLSIRSRLFYVGDTSKVYVALDVLYGVKTLDPNLAVRCRRT